MPNILVHLVINLALIGLIARFDPLFKQDKKGIVLAVFASHLIDLDHLLADPIYDPARCSVTTHPLHRWFMFPVYAGLALFSNRRIRYLGVALLLHVILDALWCL